MRFTSRDYTLSALYLIQQEGIKNVTTSEIRFALNPIWIGQAHVSPPMKMPKRYRRVKKFADSPITFIDDEYRASIDSNWSLTEFDRILKAFRIPHKKGLVNMKKIGNTFQYNITKKGIEYLIEKIVSDVSLGLTSPNVFIRNMTTALIKKGD